MSNETCRIIDFEAYRDNTHLLIQDQNEEYYSDEIDVQDDHKTEPIKNLDDISKIHNYFMDKHQYRNAVIFTVGTNIGLRISDLLRLKFKTFYEDDWTPKINTQIVELKTMNTRGRKKNVLNMTKFLEEYRNYSDEIKRQMLDKAIEESQNTYKENKKKKAVARKILVNPLVYSALDLYLQTMAKHPSLDDYIFTGYSHRKTPMTRQTMWKIFDKVSDDLNMGIRIGTHGLRKTFGYHMMSANNFSDEALHVLQQLFGHSSSAITLRYIGITTERIKKAYMDVGNALSSVVEYPEIGVLNESKQA